MISEQKIETVIWGPEYAGLCYTTWRSKLY